MRWSLLLALIGCLGVLAAPASAADPPGGNGWNATAAGYRGQNGARYEYTCPKYGAKGGVWGTDVYTDDSSVCTAGVHTGQITLAGGGTVTIEIRPGESSYSGTARHRVTSSSYPAWSGSFVVVGAVAQPVGVAPGGNAWTSNAGSYRNWVGAQYTYDCPPKGRAGPLWGTNVYTDDSSVCTAGVHSGVITLDKGGDVTIEMRDGLASYRGTTRRGIKSSGYGPWPGAFVVVGGLEGPDTFEAFATGRVLVNGQPFTEGTVRYGSTVDVTGGTLQMTAPAVGSVLVNGDGADPAAFVLKKIPEKLGRRKVTRAELALAGGDFGSCSLASLAAGKSNETVRALWAKGSGRFRTKGRYSSATVRGTNWLTSDRCDGTFTQVKQGSVAVRDVRRKKTVVVKAGRSYLAKAP